MTLKDKIITILISLGAMIIVAIAIQMTNHVLSIVLVIAALLAPILHMFYRLHKIEKKIRKGTKPYD